MVSILHIKRFKNISDLRLELDNLNVLIGANNSGKSSVLQAIQFAVSVAQSAKLENSSRWINDTLTTTLSHSQLVYSPLRDVEALAPGRIFTQNPNNAIEIELKDTHNNTAKILVRRGKNKNISVTLEGAALGRQLESLSEPYSIYVPGLAGIPAAEEYKTPGIVRKAAAKGDANNVFRNVLWLLKQQTDQWQNFRRDFNKVFPDIEIDVSFNDDQDENLNASITFNGSVLPIDAAGTGCLQAIQILAYVNVYRPRLLILDEPDSHLHPTNQRKLTKMLISLAEERDVQIILATHSRHITDELRLKAKHHWIRSGQCVQEEQMGFGHILMDIGALDKSELLLSGRIKCVILTEDSSVEPLEVLLVSSGFKIDEIDIWPYKGCTKTDVAIALSNFIKHYAPTTVVMIHRDRDYYISDELAQYQTVLNSMDIKCFITKGNDCESYYISAEHITTLYPEIDIMKATEIVVDTTSQMRDKSIKKFVNTRYLIKRVHYKESNPDVADTYRECESEYDENPEYYRHGKTVLGPLKAKIQQELKRNINLIRVSRTIKDENLMKFAEEIWGV